MKETRVTMGMPVTVEIIDSAATKTVIQKVFEYFARIDEKFSTYKSTSEITAINEGKLPEEQWSEEMRLIFALAEETKRVTDGYFDMKTPTGAYDPSGLVKGWAIWNAAQVLKEEGLKNFYVDAGGDIQPSGVNAEGKPWAVGIKNPWNEVENVKVVNVTSEGVATSGTYIRGLHIYNPKAGNKPVSEIMSLTVVGPNIYEADRFATAAFAMGREGINFIERLDGFEGYLIDKDKVATMTSGFEKYTQ
ncbi:MAG TPA: FAD:protein FMN transferase [Candidatus Paceibacterota bacterium]|jgi:thiamine biosynthesis lipoprotein|nr:FAD:protein FMN transferase [Candidatus Paceibacterota bacterium]